MTHAIDDCRRAVVFEAAFARGRIDRNANRVDRPVVWDRLAVFEQTREGEDAHALERDEQGVELLRCYLRPHRRPQGPNLLGRQMRVRAGRGVMHDEAELG